jgi:hypothetical protein
MAKSSPIFCATESEHFDDMKKFLCGIALVVALAGCGWDQSTSRSDKPVSRQNATNRIDIPLPLSARDVCYYIHSGGLQEFQMFVRFTVDSNELESAASNILSDHDRKYKEQLGYSTSPFASAPSPSPPVDLPWWNPQSITNGFYRACTNGQPFEIRADLSTYTIYLSASD